MTGRRMTHPGFTWTKHDGAGLVVPPHAAADCATPAGCEAGRTPTCADCANSHCPPHTPRSEKVCPTCITNMLRLLDAYFCDRCQQAWSLTTPAGEVA